MSERLNQAGTAHGKYHVRTTSQRCWKINEKNLLYDEIVQKLETRIGRRHV